MVDCAWKKDTAWIGLALLNNVVVFLLKFLISIIKEKENGCLPVPTGEKWLVQKDSTESTFGFLFVFFFFI